MLLHMRTTLRLDDGLLREVKRLAAETHRTMSAVFEDALREMLARRKKSGRSPSPRLPVFHGKGLQPGVNLDHSANLLDRTEGRGGPL